MNEEVQTTPVYSMGVAERLTGLTARQIRYWEQNGLLAPTRTKGRQRLYTEGDIVRLKEIKRLLGDGMTLERVKAYFANKEAKKARQAPADPLPSHMAERIPRGTSSLYTGANRAELERFLGRRTK